MGTWREKTAATQHKCPVCETDVIHYRVEIENLGLGRVVEVEARLWLIKRKGLAKRKRIPMDVDQLLELNGKWQEARRRSAEAGNRFFHFLLPCSVSLEPLSGRDQCLFQVRSKHGFTNFGRVQRLRIKLNVLGVADYPFNRFEANDPDAGLWRRRIYQHLATVIASIAVRKHIHQFEPAGWYHIEQFISPQTVVMMRCACHKLDFQSLPGLWELGPALSRLGYRTAHGTGEVDHPGTQSPDRGAQYSR